MEDIPLPVISFEPGDAPIISQPYNGCPSKPNLLGLESLMAVEEMRIHPRRSGDYRYLVTDTRNDPLYKVQIESEAAYCKPQRAYTLQVFDNSNVPIMKASHEFGCESCLCPLYSQKVTMYSPADAILGSLEQEWNLLYPSFAIKNRSNEITLRIEGPCCQLTCCADIDFKIITPDGEKEVALISRDYDFQKLDEKGSFGLIFLEDLDLDTKVLLFGSCLVIDLIYLKVQ